GRGGDGLERGEPLGADRRGIPPAGRDRDRDGPLARDRADPGDDRCRSERDGNGRRSPGWYRRGGAPARLQGAAARRGGPKGVSRYRTPSTEGAWKSRS